MGIFSPKARCIGLDIGENSIKMAELKRSGGQFQLTDYRSVPLPQGAVDGEVIRDPQAISEAISKMGLAGNAAKVATAMGGQSVFIRYLSLPAMSQKELAEAVVFEAESLLPIPIEEATIDFIKVGEVKEDGVTKDEIMLVAARKSAVAEVQQMVACAGMEAAVLDIEPLALLRTATLLGEGSEAPGAVAMVDIGTSSTTVSVFHGRVLRFTRMVPFGGNTLTAVLMDNYGLSFEEAEATKKIVSVAGEPEQKGLSVLLHQKTELIIAYLENLVTEISRSLEFYQSRYREEAITKVLLSGGGAKLQGLTEFLRDNIHIPVELIDPVTRLQLAPDLGLRQKEIEEAGASLAVVIGLALSEVC